MRTFESYANEIGFDMQSFIEVTDNAKKEFEEIIKNEHNSKSVKAMAYHIGQLISFATMGAIETMKEENCDVGDISALYLTIIAAIVNGPDAFEKLVVSMVGPNRRISYDTKRNILRPSN